MSSFLPFDVSNFVMKINYYISKNIDIDFLEKLWYAFILYNLFLNYSWMILFDVSKLNEGLKQ